MPIPHHSLNPTMFVFLNGKLLPESEALVPISDRGFQLGDGVFETMRVYQGAPFRWVAHLARLNHGLATLGIHPPLPDDSLHDAVVSLIDRNNASDCVLRIQITRGSGQRGCSPKGADDPTITITTHPAPVIPDPPPRRSLITSRFRVQSDSPLASIKSTNRLINILAKDEADKAGADDAVLVNERGEVAELTSSNIFWIGDDTIHTPPVFCGALPGITRAAVMELAAELGIGCNETTCAASKLASKTGVFLTVSTWELLEIASIDGTPVTPSPLLKTLRTAYRELVDRETRA